MRITILLCICIIFAASVVSAAGASDHAPAYSEIKDDEVVEFFRTAAWLDEENQQWHIPIHGWIYEPEDSAARKALLTAVLQKEFKLAPEEKTKANYERRLNLLIADNERGKRIVVAIAGNTFTLPASGVNGHFETTLIIQVADLVEHVENSVIRYSAVTKDSETRTFSRESKLIEPTGLSIISDIDDTVKISNVKNRKELLRSTFLLDFAAVPEMAEVYRRWSQRDVKVHFVSSSPWQLYAPLQEFLDEAGFPQSTLNLKPVRFRDETVFDLFKKGTETKPAVIEKILRTYPGRQFVLIGDSGEHDPEVYAALLRKYPHQILKIYIRNVTGEAADNERFKSVFEDIDADCWVLFEDPLTLQLPELRSMP